MKAFLLTLVVATLAACTPQFTPSQPDQNEEPSNSEVSQNLESELAVEDETEIDEVDLEDTSDLFGEEAELEASM